MPAWLRRWLLGPAGRIYPKADWLPRAFRAKATLGNLSVDAPEAYCRSVGFLSDEDKLAFLTRDVTANLSGYRSADIIRHHMARGGTGDLDQLLYTDFKTWLPGDMLTKVDRASMAVSLEVRVPLLDHKFVEFARTVPAAMKIQQGQGKAVLKSALKPYLDDDLLYRKKQGFTPPIVEWLRTDLREMVSDLLTGPDPFFADYISPRAVAKAMQAHIKGIRNFAPLLWAVLMFELWGRMFIRGQK
ncbi:MAG TPA: hypothetical protein ENL03_06210 [Phycisphaerae bacterium]|nr:hypothetical protein [Phycisphaerae bacterium]